MTSSVLSEVGSGSKPLSVRRCRLTTFNYASYPFLSMPSTELFGLAAVGMFVSVSVGESPPCGFIVLPGRFVASTAPALPGTRLATGHLHLCRGDFPQCRTLSVVLLIPHRKAGNSAFNPVLSIRAGSRCPTRHGSRPTAWLAHTRPIARGSWSRGREPVYFLRRPR